MATARRVFSLALIAALAACDFLPKRVTKHDPKPTIDSDATRQANDDLPKPMSLFLSEISAPKSTIVLGEQMAVTVSIKDVDGDVMTGATAATVQFAFGGSGSAGTFSAVTNNRNGTYASTLTGVLAGAASEIVVQVDGSILLNTKSVQVKDASKISLETAANGSGTQIGASTLVDGTSITLYAVGRTDTNDYVRGVTVTWSETGALGAFSNTSGKSTTYRPSKGEGTTKIIATATAGITGATTQTQTINWTATDVFGLNLWLKADTLTLANAAVVPTWADRSGSANDASQGTNGARPTFKSNAVNGKPAVVFDGSSKFMTVANHASLNVTSGQSVFAVYKPTSAIAGSVLVSKSTSSALNDGWGLSDLDGTGTGWGFFVNNAFSHRVLDTTATGSFVLLAGVFDGNDLWLYKDGTQVSSMSYAAAISTSSGALTLGAAPGGASDFFAGELAEFLSYGDNLNNTDRQAVEDYLSTKYGL